jgi:hypothetical protein
MAHLGRAASAATGTSPAVDRTRKASSTADLALQRTKCLSYLLTRFFAVPGYFARTPSVCGEPVTSEALAVDLVARHTSQASMWKAPLAAPSREGKPSPAAAHQPDTGTHDLRCRCQALTLHGTVLLVRLKERTRVLSYAPVGRTPVPFSYILHFSFSVFKSVQHSTRKARQGRGACVSSDVVIEASLLGYALVTSQKTGNRQVSKNHPPRPIGGLGARSDKRQGPRGPAPLLLPGQAAAPNTAPGPASEAPQLPRSSAGAPRRCSKCSAVHAKGSRDTREGGGRR